MGHVQDTPVSTIVVNQHDFKCVYDMSYESHIVSYNLDQNFFSKSKIDILPNYEQTDLKMAIVGIRK